MCGAFCAAPERVWENAIRPQVPSTPNSAQLAGLRTVFPVLHTPYDYNEVL
jgi:hypothetical protein